MKLTADVKQNNREFIQIDFLILTQRLFQSAKQCLYVESSSVNQKQIRTIKTKYNLIQHMETLCESLQKDALTQSWKLFTVVQSQRRSEFDTIFTN